MGEPNPVVKSRGPGSTVTGSTYASTSAALASAEKTLKDRPAAAKDFLGNPVASKSGTTLAPPASPSRQRTPSASLEPPAQGNRERSPSKYDDFFGSG